MQGIWYHLKRVDGAVLTIVHRVKPEKAAEYKAAAYVSYHPVLS